MSAREDCLKKKKKLYTMLHDIAGPYNEGLETVEDNGLLLGWTS